MSSISERPVTAAEKAEFKRHDKVVKTASKLSLDAGKSWKVISEGKLWKFGEYPSWGSYCRVVGGYSKQHVNRLIKSVAVVDLLDQVEPIGSGWPAPRSESQIRPLHALTDPKQQAEAWFKACEDAGGPPTAEELKAAVDAVQQAVEYERQASPLKRQAAAREAAQVRAVIGEKTKVITEPEVEREVFDESAIPDPDLVESVEEPDVESDAIDAQEKFSRASRRHTIVNQLQELAAKKKDWQAVQRLLVELAEVI